MDYNLYMLMYNPHTFKIVLIFSIFLRTQDKTKQKAKQTNNNVIMPYLPSLKKFWFETFNFRRFCISNRQSSTTIPEKKGFLYKYYSICFHFVVYNSATTLHYCIDTDEIPGFFLLLKNHIFIAQWRYYFYLSRVRILVSPWLLIWLANYKNYKSFKKLCFM